MKMVKSILLGTAAGLVAMSGAMAADFTKAKPVQYVKVASLMYTPAANTTVIGANGFFSFNGIAATDMSAMINQPTNAARLDQAVKLGYVYIGAQAVLFGIKSGATDNGNMAKKWANGYGGAFYALPSVLGQQSATQQVRIPADANIATDTITAPATTLAGLSSA